MRVTRRSLRKSIRRVLAESMKELYGEVQNAILDAPTSIVGNMKYEDMYNAIKNSGLVSEGEIDNVIIDCIKDGFLDVRVSSDYR